MDVKEIERLCAELAAQIELAGITQGVPYAAAQSQYGVTWEYLPNGGEWSGEWIGHNNLDSDIEDVLAVRFVDCDGERGSAAYGVVELLKEAVRWVEQNQSYCAHAGGKRHCALSAPRTPEAARQGEGTGG